MSLIDQKILLGITGGIAAYKIPDLVRKLKKEGANIRIVMTESAKHFVSELTLQTLSGHKVHSELFDTDAELAMGHIELAKWADVILIAPCTANVITKLSIGLADDLLTTLCLATNAPIILAPAMNQQMFQNKIIQHNLTQLSSRNFMCCGPASGEQACGDIGYGRMEEPDEIISFLKEYFSKKNIFKGITITITAGPTQEAIDPVRYISNHSSGKMGYALAEQAVQLGATVNLISGPVNLPPPNNVNLIKTTSAEEMNKAVKIVDKQSDIFIGCAAVADYRSTSIAKQKLKKQDDKETLTLTLIKNPDIIANVAKRARKNRPFVVGFAAETENIKEYAQQKLIKKNLDMICANNVSDKDIGFNSDENSLTVITKNDTLHIPKGKKTVIANTLLLTIFKHYLEYRKIKNEKNRH